MKVSIVTATYNCGRTLRASLDSLARQTYRKIEHVIVDGASTDDTLRLIENYAENVDYEVKLISEPDEGVYDALNKGIKLATGDVVGLLHSDDMFASDRVIERIVEVLSSNEYDGCYGDIVYVDREDTSKMVRYWKAGKYNRKKLLLGWMPPHPTCFLKRSVYERFGLFDTSYKIAADYDFMVRILYTGGVRLAYIPEVITIMRSGGMSNKSLKNRILVLRENYAVMKKHGLPAFRALLVRTLSRIPQFVVGKAHRLVRGQGGF